MRPPRTFDHAVLSPFFRQHPNDLIKPNPPPLDQTDEHAHMMYDRRECFALRFHDYGAMRTSRVQVALAVLITLPVGMFAVIGCAALRAGKATVRIPAPETTTQIVPARVARIGEKQNPTMPTTLQVAPQIGTLAQQQPNLGIVRPHRTARFAATRPIRPILEMECDLGC